MTTYKITGPGIDKTVSNTDELSAELWRYFIDNPHAADIDDMLDEAFGSITIGQGEYWASLVLKECDPISYDGARDEEIEFNINDAIYSVENGDNAYLWDVEVEAINDDDFYNASVRKSAKPILDIYDDADGELHVIFADGLWYGIGYGYNPDREPGNSTWRNGSYDFKTYEDALKELQNMKGIVRNVSSRYPQFITKSKMLKNIPSSGAIYRNFPTNESRQTYQIPTWMQNAISRNVIPKRGNMEGLMKNKYSGTKDRKLKKNMSMTKSKKFYFTYGTDPMFPYGGGWTEIHADTYEEAADKHAKVFGTLDFGFGRFAEGFTEEMWQKSGMKDKGNFGAFCHHVIE